MSHRAAFRCAFGLATLAVCALAGRVRADEAPPDRTRGRTPAASGETLVEEDSPALTWIGSWSRNALPVNSGGSARLAMDTGAQVRFNFTGTGVRWIGYRDEWCGFAKVSVDGEPATTVDTYATPAKAQATLYTATGLGWGPHTLTIQTTGTHAPASAGSWIWVDAFAVSQESSLASNAPSNIIPSHAFQVERQGDREKGSRKDATNQRREGALRLEQDDASVTWSGAWSTNRQSVHSGGTARLSMEPSARMSFVFTGTGVIWIGYQDQWSGIADVLLDGRLQASVDTYANPARAQAELYTIDGLSDGTHTLTIQPTGKHRPASAGSWIWVDGFSITRSATTAERRQR